VYIDVSDRNAHDKELPVTNKLDATASPMLDAELVRLAQEGDEDACASLYAAHKMKIYCICRGMTSNAAEAEDLTQAAFLQVFRKLASFRGNSAFSTWLYRVAVNTVLMHFRKRGLCQESLDEPVDRESGGLKVEQGKVDSRLSASIDRIVLTRAVKELPVGYRTIFLLHDVEGYSHQEIAHLLRCSVGNSKSQLHKARTRMRELLGGQESHDGNQALNQRKAAPQSVPRAEPSPSQPVTSGPWETASEAAA
jgi:RNA polymerase sigma-70 factor, ECF subfamily